jgi:hypothetical protein
MPSQQPTVGLALHLGEVGPLADNDVDQCEVGDLRGPRLAVGGGIVSSLLQAALRFINGSPRMEK